MKVKCGGCGRYFPQGEAVFRTTIQSFCSDPCLPGSSFRVRRETKQRSLVPKRPRKKTTSQVSPQVRQRVLARDGSCRMCGAWTVHLHHIVYRSGGGPHTEDNLIALCAKCHETVHSEKSRWQPVLIETIRLTAKGKKLTVLEIERSMRGR